MNPPGAGRACGNPFDQTFRGVQIISVVKLREEVEDWRYGCAMDVLLKEGSLFLQGLQFGKKIWRKIWVRVFKPSEAGIGRIEMYDVREAAKLKKAERRVIRLAECLSVTPALGESCPADCTAFYLNTVQRIYTLAAPAHEEWVPALCTLVFQCDEGRGDQARGGLEDGVRVDLPMTENNIYSSFGPGQFQVSVVSSEASTRCCMFGSYLLSPEKESLCLLDMKTGQVEFCWPYRYLRRFGQVKEGVSIEAGRRSQTGEGVFIFISKQRQQIYKAIEEAIMHQHVQDLLSKATALSQDSTPPTSSLSSPQITQRNPGPPPLPALKPPALTSPSDLFAKVKPVPKPMNTPSPPLPPPPPPTMPEPKPIRTKPNSLDISYEWNQNATDASDQLYSKVAHHPRETDPGRQTERKNPAGSRQPPKVGNKPDSFKEILSGVLFKGMSRTAPPYQPSSHSSLLADPVYHEIQ